MLDSRNDCPTASSTGFGATTTTTRGISGVEADDDDGVDWFQKLKRSKKIPQRSPKSMCMYSYSSKHMFLCMRLFLWLAARKL